MAYINHIETQVPMISYTQEEAANYMKRWVPDRKARKYIDGIYADSGIEKRHSVIPDFVERATCSEGIFALNKEGIPNRPTTGERNDLYIKEAKPLTTMVAKKVVDGCQGVSSGDITHVITVSCTGFSNPGLDLAIVQELHLADSVERYQLGFMGCYAAFPALRMAEQFCQAQSDAVVLIVCTELCSLHVQLEPNLDNIIANSVFADGAAAVIVSNKKLCSQQQMLKIESFASKLISCDEDSMAWDIGDLGFNITLSKYVPKIIGANIKDILLKIWNGISLDISEIDFWAVHPGGKSILDKVEQSLDLLPYQIVNSRSILSQYGNMSSATILFVLQSILLDPKASCKNKICAMAFGPGLTVETAVLAIEH